MTSITKNLFKVSLALFLSMGTMFVSFSSYMNENVKEAELSVIEVERKLGIDIDMNTDCADIPGSSNECERAVYLSKNSEDFNDNIIHITATLFYLGLAIFLIAVLRWGNEYFFGEKS